MCIRDSRIWKRYWRYSREISWLYSADISDMYLVLEVFLRIYYPPPLRFRVLALSPVVTQFGLSCNTWDNCMWQLRARSRRGWYCALCTNIQRRSTTTVVVLVWKCWYRWIRTFFCTCVKLLVLRVSNLNGSTDTSCLLLIGLNIRPWLVSL